MKHRHRLATTTSPLILAAFLATSLLAIDRRTVGPAADPEIAINPDYPSEYDDPDAQKKLIQRVESYLPKGWVISGFTTGSTPPDWRTFRPRAGVMVEARKGAEWLRIWFLPTDWIGIRMVDDGSCGTIGIKKSDRFTVITNASNQRIQEAAEKWLGGSWPSLCNGGWSQSQDIFGGRLKETDRITLALVRKHCRTKKEFANAADSLVILGVPARSVTLRAVRELRFEDISSGLGKDGFYSVLGNIGDDECIECLCEQLEKTGSKYVVYSIPSRDHKRIGPALHNGLSVTEYDENIVAIANAIADRQYKPAAADVLKALDRVENLYYKADVAAALATLRHQEAVPKLKELVKAVEGKEDSYGKNETIQLALSRLVDYWGDEKAEVRHHLIAPKVAKVGEPIVLKMYCEFNYRGERGGWREPERQLYVDGKLLIPPRTGRFLIESGSFISSSAPRGHVQKATYDLSKHLNKPGKYSIQFGKPDSKMSNVVVIDVRP